MRHKTLLISIRRLRMLEVDGLGAFTQVELAVARGSRQPERVSFAFFTPDTRKGGRHNTPGESRKRWEAR